MIKKHSLKPKKDHKKHDGWEYATKERRSLYKTTQWKKIRKAYLLINPYCVICGKKANVLDHITRWKSEYDFYNGPFQSMCWTHHQQKRGFESGKDRRGEDY